MEITIDLESCRIIVHFDQWHKYAVFIDKQNGETMRLTIPELTKALDDYVAWAENNQVKQ